MDQIDKLVRNCFNFELVFRKAGKTNINTAIRDIAGITCSKFKLLTVLCYNLFLTMLLQQLYKLLKKVTYSQYLSIC